MLWRILLIAGCVLCIGGAIAMGFEEIVYTVASADGKIEIRDYDSVVVAEVITDGQRRDGENSAFMTLFRYIDKGNAEKQKIAMTVPVTQQSIATESPAPEQERADDQEIDTPPQQWTFTFFLPPSMQLSSAPQPQDERITLRTLPPRRLIALRFNGGRSAKNIAKHEQELRSYLAQQDITYREPPLYAFYNGPFTPNVLRRNEILFELP